jgi:hypothetical protein
MVAGVFSLHAAYVKYGVRYPEYFWAPVYSCTRWLRPRNSPHPRIWGRIRGCYWSARIDKISLYSISRLRENGEVTLLDALMQPLYLDSMDQYYQSSAGQE